MHSAVGVYLRTEDWIEDDPHPNLRCQLIDVCGNCSICVMCACTTVRGTIVLDIFFHQFKHKVVVPFSSLSTWCSQADPGLGPHATSAIPKRQAEALYRRALAGREAHLGANHPATLGSMHNLAGLLWQQGKLAEVGLWVFRGER